MATPLDFIENRAERLTLSVKEYLEGVHSHQYMREMAWQTIEEWQAIDVQTKSMPYVNGEKAFWAIVWSLVHVTDEEHWTDQVPQRELPVLVEIVERRGDLPFGYDAKRPG
jgi:hypothetical protein